MIDIFRQSVPLWAIVLIIRGSSSLSRVCDHRSTAYSECLTLSHMRHPVIQLTTLLFIQITKCPDAQRRAYKHARPRITKQLSIERCSLVQSFIDPADKLTSSGSNNNGIVKIKDVCKNVLNCSS